MKLLNLREVERRWKVEYSPDAPGMRRRALRHEDIRLTYAPRWKGNLLNGRREGGEHSKAALSGTDGNETPLYVEDCRGETVPFCKEEDNVHAKISNGQKIPRHCFHVSLHGLLTRTRKGISPEKASSPGENPAKLDGPLFLFSSGGSEKLETGLVILYVCTTQVCHNQGNAIELHHNVHQT